MDNLKLLAGMPQVIEPNICLVYPLTLREIAGMGLKEYYKKIQLLTLSDYDVEEILEQSGAEITEKQISAFDFLTINSLSVPEFFEEFKSAMRLATKDKISIIPYEGYVAIALGELEEQRIMTKEHFEDFQNIVRAQNMIEVLPKMSEKEKEMKRKFEKNRRKVAKAKEKAGKASDLTLDVLVSALSVACDGINIVNVWDLSIYTFNDQFTRNRMLEQYRESIQQLCAGADPKKIELKPYIRQITNEQ